MGVKHQKTRKEKIIADYRHNVYTLETSISPLPSPSLNVALSDVVINPNSQSYSYVLKDVLKTGLLTLSIIVGELVLYFLFKNHIIAILRISY